MENFCLSAKGSFIHNNLEKTFAFYALVDGCNDNLNYSNYYIEKVLKIKLSTHLTSASHHSESEICDILTNIFYELHLEILNRSQEAVTLLLAFVFEDKMYVANVGISTTLLIKENTYYVLNEPMRPFLYRMQKSLVKRNVPIVKTFFSSDAQKPIYLVNKKYNSARILGDSELSWKPKITRVFERSHEKQKDMVLKQIVYFDDSDILLLASQGLWEVVTFSEVYAIIIEKLKEGLSLEAIATQLKDIALQVPGSKNITVGLFTNLLSHTTAIH